MAKVASAVREPSALYEHDYYAWIQNQVRALRKRRVDEIDWLNVAEEIEYLGKSERHSVESQIARIAEHFLKLAHAPARTKALNRRGWELTIREARHQIRKLLNESPSLRRKATELLSDGYESGRTYALIALKLPDAAIPESSPWTVAQILDEGFLPNDARHPGEHQQVSSRTSIS
jgi:hypothetical protein